MEFHRLHVALASRLSATVVADVGLGTTADSELETTASAGHNNNLRFNSLRERAAHTADRII